MTARTTKKHSAVIARFTPNYLKPEILPRGFSKLISDASLIRNRCDSEDFYICSVEDAERLISGTEEFLRTVSAYLQPKYDAE